MAKDEEVESLGSLYTTKIYKDVQVNIGVQEDKNKIKKLFYLV